MTDRIVLSGREDRIVVTTPALAVVATRTPDTVIVATPGTQGPPGPAGPAGSGGGSSFSVQAGVNVSAYKLVVPRLVEGTVILADNQQISHATRPLWLALAAALTGETFSVAGDGLIVNAGWNWVQGPIFLGTEGGLTQTAPVAPAVFSAQVGYSVSPTSMFLERVTSVVLTA